MTTVVLGWDGLDPELAQSFGVSESFGPHRATIDTIVNPVLETPHTRELWPTLITGAPPEEHGIRVGTPGDSLDWEHGLVDTAADVASHVLPHSIRTAIGRHLRNAGADLEDEGPDSYAERGLTTVFDGRDSVALAIPNYWTELSEALGLTGSRKATFRSFMSVTSEGKMDVRESTDTGELEQRLWSAATTKLGAARAAIARDHDIVWLWLGYLDTVGHLAPALDAGGLQERAYRQAATWTEQLRAAMQPEDELVCVSDHGLQDGDHTHEAFLGATDPSVVDGVDCVTGVRDSLEDILTDAGTGETPVREPYQAASEEPTASADAVKQQLEDLGYL